MIFQRKIIISGAPVIVEPAVIDSGNEDQQQALLELTRQDQFRQLLMDMMDAVGKGFSVSEILWSTDTPSGRWEPRGYRWRDPRRFRVDARTGGGLRLRDGSPDGVPLPRHKYVVHTAQLKTGKPIRSGLAYAASMAFLFKRYGIRDMHRFLEVAGIPARIAKVPDADWSDKAKVNRLLMMVQKIGAHAAGVLPSSIELEFLKAGTSDGAAGYVRVAEWWDQQVSKGVLGQTMTTDNGSSKSQATVHDSVRHEVATFDARVASATLNRFLVSPFIELNWGVQPVYPRLSIVVREKHALSSWMEAVATAADRGVQISQRLVRERLGIPDPKPGDELLTPAASQPRGAGAQHVQQTPPEKKP